MITEIGKRLRGPGVALAVAVLVVLSATAPAAAGSTSADAAVSEHQEAFVVAVQADGSADVTLRLTYNLTDDEEREAFRTLQDDDSAKQATRDRFRDRMAGVAAAAENETGREMAITDASISLETVAGGDVGVVELGVTWEGLAAVSGDRLVVSEPFASGFEPPNPFVLTAPDGYVVEDVSPGADGGAEASASWNAGASLEGFEATLAPESTETATDDSGDGDGGSSDGGGQPGFGAAAALVGALVAAVLLARRR